MSTTDKVSHSNNDKLAEVHDRLVAVGEDLVSGEDWRAFLEASQRLHSYSASNVLLILSQFPGATRVGGYRTWKGPRRHPQPTPRPQTLYLDRRRPRLRTAQDCDAAALHRPCHRNPRAA